MFTNKIDKIFIDLSIRDTDVYGLGYSLKDSGERRGSISVIYDITGEYRKIDYGFKRYRISKKNIGLFKQAESLYDLIKIKGFSLKNKVKQEEENILKSYSISEIVSMINIDPKIIVIAELKEKLYKLEEQDTSNRKKNWFFSNGVSKDFKNAVFYINETKRSIRQNKSDNDDLLTRNMELRDIEYDAAREYDKFITSEIITLSYKMISQPDNVIEDIHIADIVGEELFLKEPYPEDKDFEDKIFTFLKSKQIWRGTFIDFEDAKLRFCFKEKTYGLFSDSRDSVDFKDFMKMVYHNPKFYNHIKEFFNN